MFFSSLKDISVFTVNAFPALLGREFLSHGHLSPSGICAPLRLLPGLPEKTSEVCILRSTWETPAALTPKSVPRKAYPPRYKPAGSPESVRQPPRAQQWQDPEQTELQSPQLRTVLWRSGPAKPGTQTFGVKPWLLSVGLYYKRF